MECCAKLGKIPSPKHAAVAGWKHRALPFVEQDGLPPIPEDRGAEQGDVDPPIKFSIGIGGS